MIEVILLGVILNTVIIFVLILKVGKINKLNNTVERQTEEIENCYSHIRDLNRRTVGSSADLQQAFPSNQWSQVKIYENGKLKYDGVDL